MKRSIALSGLGILALVCLSADLSAQGFGRGRGGGQAGRGGSTEPAPPAPRLPDGRINLGPLPGETGVWAPGGTGFAARGGIDVDFPEKPPIEDVPFKPWARAIYEFRLDTQFEPHARCKASGGARQFITPYGVEIVNIPEIQRMYVFDIGGPHTYRIVYMDGREHPEDWIPSYYGHSVGHWEGDTLVIETVGFNERFWMERAGFPHTERLRFIERLTREDFNRMRYEITIDDPGAYTEEWSTGFYLTWRADRELFEFVCQDNNFASELMISEEGEVHRISRIAP